MVLRHFVMVCNRLELYLCYCMCVWVCWLTFEFISHYICTTHAPRTTHTHRWQIKFFPLAQHCAGFSNSKIVAVTTCEFLWMECFSVVSSWLLSLVQLVAHFWLVGAPEFPERTARQFCFYLYSTLYIYLFIGF